MYTILKHQHSNNWLNLEISIRANVRPVAGWRPLWAVWMRRARGQAGERPRDDFLRAFGRPRARIHSCVLRYFIIFRFLITSSFRARFGVGRCTASRQAHSIHTVLGGLPFRAVVNNIVTLGSIEFHFRLPANEVQAKTRQGRFTIRDMKGLTGLSKVCPNNPKYVDL